MTDDPKKEVQPLAGEPISGSPHSINEPEGSNVAPAPPEQPPPEQPVSEEAEATNNDPDELEDELDEAIEEGDVTPVKNQHRTPPSKRKK